MKVTLFSLFSLFSAKITSSVGAKKLNHKFHASDYVDIIYDKVIQQNSTNYASLPGVEKSRINVSTAALNERYLIHQ